MGQVLLLRSLHVSYFFACSICRNLKMYIKTLCCFPERCTVEEYEGIMVDFRNSEKVNIRMIFSIFRDKNIFIKMRHFILRSNQFQIKGPTHLVLLDVKLRPQGYFLSTWLGPMKYWGWTFLDFRNSDGYLKNKNDVFFRHFLHLSGGLMAFACVSRWCRKCSRIH